jgi:RNase P/RNase MRP subunit p30
VSVDLGILPPDVTKINSFSDMATKLGLSGFAVVGPFAEPFSQISENMMVYSRALLHGNSINSVRKQIDKIRRKSMIVSAPLKSIEITNWAAEDNRVDLLTVDPSQENRLRDTTAHLASVSNTMLEIQIAPLLKSSGLNRSKILKSYREAVSTARDGGMDIVLTSGACNPMGLRSSVAMVHIGILLGMDRDYADNSVTNLPLSIIERNMRKLQPGFVSSGVEVIQKGKEK